MVRPILILALLASAVPALATEPAPRTSTIVVYGNDPCPKAKGDEIVVCARQPESERYRIPKAFRAPPRVESGESASWGSRAETLETAQRFTLPNGCSPVGSFGQSGCTQAAIRQWFLERRMAKDLLQPRVP